MSETGLRDYGKSESRVPSAEVFKNGPKLTNVTQGCFTTFLLKNMFDHFLQDISV